MEGLCGRESPPISGHEFFGARALGALRCKLRRQQDDSENASSGAAEQRQKTQRALVVHPPLFAAFPVLFLFARNIGEFYPKMIFVPLVTTLCLSLVAWAVLTIALADGRRAGLIVSLFCLLFFSFENVLSVTRDVMARVGVPVAQARTCLLISWAIIFALGTYFATTTRRSLHNATNIANVVASALVLMSVANIVAYGLRGGFAWQENVGTQNAEIIPEGLRAPDALPNIYYIILDGYARADVLQELYQQDNSGFLGFLATRGFYVADDSRANYCKTALSLASSLNLAYLDDLAERVGTDCSSMVPAYQMARDNRVFRFLREMGYQVVAFSTGWVGTEMRDADIYMAARWYPDEFQSQLITMTPFRPLWGDSRVHDMYALHRERILYTLDHLSELPQVESPVFVFAHVLAPHPPFVFGRLGEPVDPGYRFTLHDGQRIVNRRNLTREEYVQGYVDQLMFINAKVQDAVDGILMKSSRPAIIILQGDHGPGSMYDSEDLDSTHVKERLSILNAYYLPGDREVPLYQGITPVNTFRLVFNAYFETDYELLRDESYFSTRSLPYAFTNVTDRISGAMNVEDQEWTEDRGLGYTYLASRPRDRHSWVLASAPSAIVR